MKAYVLAIIVALGLAMPSHAFQNVRMRSYDDCMRDRSDYYNAQKTKKDKEDVMNECKEDGKFYNNYYEKYCKKTHRVALDTFQYSSSKLLAHLPYDIWQRYSNKSKFAWKSIGGEKPKCWIRFEMTGIQKKHHLDDGTPFKMVINAYAKGFYIIRGIIYINEAYIVSVE